MPHIPTYRSPMLVFLIAIVCSVLLVACSSGSDEAPSLTPTSTPGLAAPTASGIVEATPTRRLPTPTPTAMPTPTVDSVTSGDHTGIPEIDAVLDIIRAEDRTAFEALLRLTETPCTNALGLGGPPKCFDFPGPPSEGTPVEAFYHLTCEGEWRTDLDVLVDVFFLSRPELYALVELNLKRPFGGGRHLPQPNYGLLFEMGGTNYTGTIEYRNSLLLGVERDGTITLADFSCGLRTPDFFLSAEAEPAYGEDVELIHIGPALQARTGTETGIPGVDAVIAAIHAGDKQALEDLFAFTTAPCTYEQGLGGPPKCDVAPGSPPEGTEVEAFPTGFCEGAWTYDLSPIIEGLVVSDLELYAVLWDRASQPVAPYPYIEYELVFAYEDERFDVSPLTRIVRVGEGKVRSVTTLCLAPPSFGIRNQDPGRFVILYGPAFP